MRQATHNEIREYLNNCEAVRAVRICRNGEVYCFAGTYGHEGWPEGYWRWIGAGLIQDYMTDDATGEVAVYH